MEINLLLLLQLLLVLLTCDTSICASFPLVYNSFFHIYIQILFTHEIICDLLYFCPANKRNSIQSNSNHITPNILAI